MDMSLVMPFTDDSPSFSRGYEMGRLDIELSLGATQDFTIRVENEQQARMIANMHGLDCEIEPTSVDGWLAFRAKPKPMLRLVKG